MFIILYIWINLWFDSRSSFFSLHYLNISVLHILFYIYMNCLSFVSQSQNKSLRQPVSQSQSKSLRQLVSQSQSKSLRQSMSQSQSKSLRQPCFWTMSQCHSLKHTVLNRGQGAMLLCYLPSNLCHNKGTCRQINQL